MTTKQELTQKISELQAQVDAMPDAPKVRKGVIYDAPEDGCEVWVLWVGGEVEISNFNSSLVLFHERSESQFIRARIKTSTYRG